MHMDENPGKCGESCRKIFSGTVYMLSLQDSGIVAPMFISEKKHIDEIVDKFRNTLDKY